MRFAAKRIVILIVAYLGLGLLIRLLANSFNVQGFYRNVLYALLGFVATLHIFSFFSSRLIKNYGNIHQAKTTANVLRFIGFLVALLIFLYFVKVDVSFLLLGGSVGGIILGFAAQKTMENIFAGILILLSRNVEIGDRIRVISATLPQTTLTFPSYKFYSYDYLIQGYAGIVEEIGLFFTKITLDSGLLMVLPNSILLTSGVVNVTKTKATGQKMLTKVRYELPLNVDVEATLQAIRERLAKTIELRDVLVSEKNQDRNTIIIAVEAFFENKREDTVKSEILTELIKLEKEQLGVNPSPASPL